MKTGTIVDAPLIAAPSSTKNAAKKRDQQMSSTRKANQWHFGMEASVRAKVEHPFRVIK